MGDFLQDVMDSVRFGFSWIRDIEVWKYYLALILAQILLFGLVFGAVLAFAAAIGIHVALFSDISYWTHFFTGSNMAGLVGVIFGILFVGVLIGLLYYFAISYLSLYIMTYGLRKKQLSAIHVTPRKVLSFIFVGIVAFLQAVFCWRDKTYLLLGVVSAMLLGIGMGSWNLFTLFLGFMLMFVYLLIVYYMSVRLSLSMYAFAHEDLSVSEALSVSWKLTQGRVLGVFARIVGASLTVYVLIALVLLIPNALFWGIRVFMSTVGMAGIGVLLQQGFGMITGPLYTLSVILAVLHVYHVMLQEKGLVKVKRVVRSKRA
ncbi:hypothetical protein KJ765_03545 [Candidatus Micrarchaeota archaeon]|nr:hypothetical protein [Candidatus Micrarchaeota archaeon]